MNSLKTVIFGSFFGLPALLCAGNPYYVTFPVTSLPISGVLGQDAVVNSGAVILRDNKPAQVAYQMGGPDGSGIGRIFTRPGKPSYVLTDVGSQWSNSVALNQTVLAVLECYSPQYGWDGAAFSAAQSGIITKSSITSDSLFMDGLTLTAVPLPTLFKADTSTVQVSIPAYVDAGGQADGLVLWRQDSSGSWQNLTTLPVTASVLTYADASVAPNASYWYGISVSYSWPGGGQEGALPLVDGHYVSMARSCSALMVAASVQPTPTFAPTFTPSVKHDLGTIGWAAGPNPSRDGKFRIEFQTAKPAKWNLQVFGIDGNMVKDFQGNTQQLGWQIINADLTHLASGVYLMDLHVTPEGESEKTLPLRKVAIIR
ncbi:MAG TPA: T9SS type A sorting domain-containing protein [bacterium]|nr:T9SS type A sorting domain-containing protein [bacterium]